MDLSKIREAARLAKGDIVTSPNHLKIISMMSAGTGDRRFKLIFDKNLYTDNELKSVISQIEDTALKYRLRGTRFLSFANHDAIEGLAKVHPTVEFIPRSKFFHDVSKYL